MHLICNDLKRERERERERESKWKEIKWKVGKGLCQTKSVNYYISCKLVVSLIECECCMVSENVYTFSLFLSVINDYVYYIIAENVGYVYKVHQIATCSSNAKFCSM